MELILISYDSFFKGEALHVASLMENYDFIFHLRKPDSTIHECKAFLKLIPKKYHNRIMLHDHHELAEEFKLKGLHYSTIKRTLSNNYPESFRSTSCHSVQETEELDSMFNYLFLSPVFPSISKRGYTGNLKMEDVKIRLRQNRKSKIIALGGIVKTKVDRLISWGFDGVALLGTVWGDDPQADNNIEKRFKSIYQCIKQDHIV